VGLAYCLAGLSLGFLIGVAVQGAGDGLEPIPVS